MKFRYTRYTGEDLEGVDVDELVSKLSRMLLSSGFDNPHGDPFEDDEGHSVQDLHDAIDDYARRQRRFGGLDAS